MTQAENLNMRALGVVFLFAAQASAAPFIFNDPQLGTHCSFRLDTIPVIDIPLMGGICRLNIDIPGLAFDTLHVVRFATVEPGPPRAEGPQGVEFQFRKVQNPDGSITWQGWTTLVCDASGICDWE